MCDNNDTRNKCRPPPAQCPLVRYESRRTGAETSIRIRLAECDGSICPCTPIPQVVLACSTDADCGRGVVRTDLYSKGLAHDAVTGQPSNADLDALIEALRCRSYEKLNALTLAGPRLFLNPSAAWSLDLIGPTTNAYCAPCISCTPSKKGCGQKKSHPFIDVPTFRQRRIIPQAVELYSMALARDVQFIDYLTDPIIAAQAVNLNAATVAGGTNCCDCPCVPQMPLPIVPATLFRGTLDGDLNGPYVSQFLLADLPGALFDAAVINPESRVPQRYLFPLPGQNFMTVWADALSVQNGAAIDLSGVTFDATRRYIRTGRDLAWTFFFADSTLTQMNTFVTLPWIRAAAIMRDLLVQTNPQLALSTVSSNEQWWVTMGQADVESTIAYTVRLALQAAAYFEWGMLRGRPEELGIILEAIRNGALPADTVANNLLLNPVFAQALGTWGTYLLPQTFPQGSPMSPSFPNALAAAAGAAITVLKFFYDTDLVIPLFAPDATGTTLIDTGVTGTVLQELNKLASNVSLSTAWAGINFRQDNWALALGESVAVRALHEWVYRYPFPIDVTLDLGLAITSTNCCPNTASVRLTNRPCHNKKCD